MSQPVDTRAGGPLRRGPRLAALQTRSRSMWRREVRDRRRGRGAASVLSRRPLRPMVPYLFARFARHRVSGRSRTPSRVRYGPPPRSVRNNARMRISARADYAVRAALQLAAAQDAGPLKAEAIAEDQGISHKFLEGILGDMRKGGLVQSQRGGNGGYWLARPAESISVAEVIRCVDGPLVSVRGNGRRTSRTRVRPSRCSRCGSPCGPASVRCSACRSRRWRRRGCRTGSSRSRTIRRPGPTPDGRGPAGPGKRRGNRPRPAPT